MILSLKTFWQKHQHALIALGFAIWGLYLRFDRMAHRDLWTDEINQVRNTVGALRPFWNRADFGELTCFPGDYLLTYWSINAAAGNKWIMVIPHIIATVISFWLLHLLCRRYIVTVLGTLIAFMVFTYNTNLVFHAFELRPYSVLILLGLAVFYCTEMIISAQYTLSAWQKFWIGLLFFVTIQFHAYGVIVVFFPTLFFILKEWRMRPLKDIIARVFKFYALLAVFALPLWFWYASGTTQFGRLGVFDYIPDPRLNAVGFLKSVFGNLIGYKIFYPLLAVMAAALVIPHKDRRLHIIFFLVMVILPIAFIYQADMMKGYWFLQRQFVWVMALFAFFLGWCSDALWMRARKGAGHQ